jgi:PAP2 superfamily
MRETKEIKLLPHELLFGAFLLVTWFRLVAATRFASRDALVFLMLLAVNVLLIRFCLLRQTDFRWRLRLLFYPLAMNLSYFQMRFAVPVIHPKLEDAFLQKVDYWMIGTNLSLRMEPLIHPVLTEFFSFCYFIFLPYLTFSMLWYFFGNLELLKKFYAGLFSVYGIGFLGYTLMPAVGPHVAMAGDFSLPLNGWLLTRWNSAIVLAGSNRVDVFPSLHCAVSSFILFFDRTHKPWRFWFYLIPCVGLWASTVYLRYHYFVDLVFGFLLSSLSLWTAARYAKNHAQKGQVHEIPASV